MNSKEQIFRHRNDIDTSSDIPVRKLNTLQLSGEFDWILLVEGSTDVEFYKMFAPSFTEFDKLSVQRKEKLYDDFEKELKKKFKKIDKLDSRKKIIHLIKAKVGCPKTKHFYGIMDHDYNLPWDYKSIESNIMFTDANSLETMMFKYAGFDNFSQKIVKAFYIYLTDSESNTILNHALKFSLMLGTIRGDKPCGFSYSSIKDYSKYLVYFAENCNFEFKIYDYVNDLIFNSQSSDKPEDWLNIINNKNFEEMLKQEDALYSIHGHDLMLFIKNLVLVCIKTKGEVRFTTKDNKETVVAIKNFDSNWFKGSPIYEWLQNIENLRGKREKSLTDACYMDYIVGVNKKK